MVNNAGLNVCVVKDSDIVNCAKNFSRIIFDNFMELTQYSYIKHSQYDIQKLLASSQMVGYIVTHHHNIIAYAFGETMILPDGRNAYYLSYIYVVSRYRKLGIGALILKHIVAFCVNSGINFVVLMCDTCNNGVVKFYKKHGFVFDTMLRTNKKHDVMCLYL